MRIGIWSTGEWTGQAKQHRAEPKPAGAVPTSVRNQDWSFFLKTYISTQSPVLLAPRPRMLNSRCTVEM